MITRPRILSVLASVALLAGGAAVLAAPAAAAGRNGTCSSGEFCYYFNSSEKGSVSDFTGSLDDYGTTEPTCYDFKGAGNGKGVCVKNNAASVWNRSSKTVRVYFHSNFAGAHQDFAPGAKRNLNSKLKNENASHQFLSAAPSSKCKTDGTNSRLPTSILVYRKSAGKVVRVDFKTYVQNVLPNEWVASWPAASLKAGAVAVKSFGWYWALHSSRKTSSGVCFDVYDNTLSQVYRPGSAKASTTAAVNATWNTRMTRSGNILLAHYCADTTRCPSYVDGDWLSQKGSRKQANAGKSYSAILHSYYDGVTLTS